MLPSSGTWRYVNRTTRTPVYSLIAVALVAEIANLASAGIVNRIIAATSVIFAAIYAFVLIGVLFAQRKGRIPAGEKGYFDLGRWLVPVSIAALCYTVVVALMMTLPAVNHVSGQYFLVIEAVGVVWFVAALRRRLHRGEAGPGRGDAQLSAESAEIQLAEGEATVS
jgi:amino acid transporter